MTYPEPPQGAQYPPQRPGQVPYPPGPPMPPQRPKSKPFTSKPAWAIYAGIAGLILGSAAGGGSATTGAEPAPTATVTETQAAEPGEPAPTVTVTAKAPTPKKKPKPAAKTWSDGDYLVGDEIPKGTFKSSGVVEDEPYCYAVTKSKSGEILEQEVTPKGSTIIRIKGSAYTFSSTGCKAWKKVG